MTNEKVRAVYDCMVYLQALINPAGPAGECIKRFLDGDVELFVSEFVFSEVRDVALRPRVAQKFGITEEAVEQFLEPIASRATLVKDVPVQFELRADPDDELYVNLAIATNSHYVVSRDKHLLQLMDVGRPPGAEFCERFPDVRVVDPATFLSNLRSLSAAKEQTEQEDEEQSD